MRKVLNYIYCSIRREELEKAIEQFKSIRIDEILQRLSKLCWKNNIQYEVLIKTKDILIIKLIGNQQIVLFKYHKADKVSRDDIDFFMGSMEEGRASKGVYITTGVFEGKHILSHKKEEGRRDVILEDCLSFAMGHLGIRGNALIDFKTDRLNLFKYMPQ
jgi:hypothetical protein